MNYLFHVPFSMILGLSVQWVDLRPLIADLKSIVACLAQEAPASCMTHPCQPPTTTSASPDRYGIVESQFGGPLESEESHCVNPKSVKPLSEVATCNCMSKVFYMCLSNKKEVKF